MGERVQIWNERGEVAHQREAAQYALLFKNPKPALKLAQLNWQRQRETADIVVYANAAINNQSTADIQISIVSFAMRLVLLLAVLVIFGLSIRFSRAQAD